MWLILRETLLVVAIGLCFGIGMTLVLGQLMGNFFLEFDIGDPVTYLGATLVILAASVFAC